MSVERLLERLSRCRPDVVSRDTMVSRCPGGVPANPLKTKGRTPGTPGTPPLRKVGGASECARPERPGPALDGDGLPCAPCRACGGGLFWKPAELLPRGPGWRCARCRPQPPDVPAHACALPPALVEPIACGGCGTRPADRTTTEGEVLCAACADPGAAP